MARIESANMNPADQIPELLEDDLHPLERASRMRVRWLTMNDHQRTHYLNNEVRRIIRVVQAVQLDEAGAPPATP